MKQVSLGPKLGEGGEEAKDYRPERALNSTMRVVEIKEQETLKTRSRGQ